MNVWLPNDSMWSLVKLKPEILAGAPAQRDGRAVHWRQPLLVPRRQAGLRRSVALTRRVDQEPETFEGVFVRVARRDGGSRVALIHPPGRWVGPAETHKCTQA